MREKTVESRHNPDFKRLLGLKSGEGRATGLVLIEGPDLLELAADHGALSTVVLESGTPAPAYDCPRIYLKRELYRELSTYPSLPKAMGVARLTLASEFGPRVIYLDGVQDPGNLGTIIRTASAFGYTGVALSKDCVSPYNSKAVQASKGALFNLPVGYADLKRDFGGYSLFLTVLDGRPLEEPRKVSGPFVLVFGHEGRGIRPENLTLAAEKVKLDIGNIDSLNVAVAAGIFMFLFKESK